MNQYAVIMFEMADRSIGSQTERICSRILSQLETDVAVEQRQEIQSKIRHELEVLAFDFFGTFDNVGCGLPEEVWGYDIQVRLPEGLAADEVDMRDGETDYADMWQEFLLAKPAKSRKSNSSRA